MNFENIELWNVPALEPVPGLGENGLVRFPRAIRDGLNARARIMGRDSAGCELRCVTDAPALDICLSAIAPEPERRAQVRIFRGNHLVQTVELETGRPRLLRLAPPPTFAPERTTKLAAAGGFAPSVWRIACNSGSTMVVEGVDAHGCEIRPPTDTEKPTLTWLAYGSSITHSSLDGYPHVAARILKADVLNKGLSGSCHFEPALVDWMVDHCKWDIASLEMGVNMLGFYTPEQFEMRAAHAINRFAATGKPFLVIDIFPQGQAAAYALKNDDSTPGRDRAFREIVHRLVRDNQTSNLRMAPGATILHDITGLSADLLHPCNFGHSLMGANVAREIRKLPGVPQA